MTENKSVLKEEPLKKVKDSVNKVKDNFKEKVNDAKDLAVVSVVFVGFALIGDKSKKR